MTTRDQYIYSLIYGNGFVHQDLTISSKWLRPLQTRVAPIVASPIITLTAPATQAPRPTIKQLAPVVIPRVTIYPHINHTKWMIISDYDLLANSDVALRELTHKMLQAINIDTYNDCTNLSIYDTQYNNIEMILSHKVEIKKRIIDQIYSCKPIMIIVFGDIATKIMFEDGRAVNKFRKEIHYIEAVPCMVTFSPRDLLSTPVQKAEAWADLQLARDFAANIS